MCIKYENAKKGIFLRRTGPFTLEAESAEGKISLHLNNTGDFSGILIPGCEISYRVMSDKSRSLKYDLIAVNTEYGWINLDSHAPNILVHQWLKTRDYDIIKPEYAAESCRFDFYAEKAFERHLLEVKGCYTLSGGVMVYPGGRSERTIRQLDGLITAAWQGYICTLVLIMPGNTDKLLFDVGKYPKMKGLLSEAGYAGVGLVKGCCKADYDRIELQKIEKHVDLGKNSLVLP